MKTQIINVKTGEVKIRDLTSEEETKYNEDIKKAKELKDAEASAKATKANNKASGKQKLKDLGLNDDEIKALTGV
tara:strand:+ start:361 stop:585 length:225 start_codon:yes stop_codon:yes gene_type:complete